MMKKGLIFIILMIVVNFSMLIYANRSFVKISDLDLETFTYMSSKSSGPEVDKLITELDNINSLSDLFSMSDAVYEIQLIETEYYTLETRNIAEVLKTYKGNELEEISVIEPFDISLRDNLVITQFGNIPMKEDVRYIVFLSQLDEAAFENSFEAVLAILGKYEIKTEDISYRTVNDDYMTHDEFYSYDYLDVYSQVEDVEIKDQLNIKYALIREELMSEINN